jgi:hypothetical protein
MVCLRWLLAAVFLMIWWKTITLDLSVECFVGPAGDDARYPTIFMALQQKSVSSCVYLCLWQRRNYLALGCRFNFYLCSVGIGNPMLVSTFPVMCISTVGNPWYGALSTTTNSISLFFRPASRTTWPSGGTCHDLVFVAWHFGYGYDPAFSLTGSTKVSSPQ